MPHPVSHDCSPSSACIWARKCIQAMKRAVRNDPTRAIPTIYEQCKSEVSRTLTQDQKIAFLSELSPFCAIKASLYRIRRERIPGGPERQISIFFSKSWSWNLSWSWMCNSLFQIYFEVNSDWFIFQNGEESIVKGDFTAENGTRILVFSTDQHFKIMARARTICACLLYTSPSPRD